MHKHAIIRLIVSFFTGLFLLSAVIGCGDDDSPTRPSTNVISKDTGGTASLGGFVIVTIPPQAISEDALVNISQTDSIPSLPEDYGFVSPAYRVSLSAGQIIDTIWISVMYDDVQLPEGQLEGSLLIGRVDGQNWVFEDPALNTAKNLATVGTLAQTRWAVVWKMQDVRETVGGLIDQVLSGLDGQLGDDLELAFEASAVEDVRSVFQDFKTHYENATGGNAGVTAAIAELVASWRAIEDNGNVVVFRTAERFTTAFLALGRAVGYDIEFGHESPPLVLIGSRRWLPTAFMKLFTYGTGILGDQEGAGHIQSRETIVHDFFVQMNYTPTFGGLTSLDFPQGYDRDSLVLAQDVLGIYRMALPRVSTQSNMTIRYDYLRDREIALYWPVEAEALFFNFPEINEAVEAVAVVAEFGKVLADFRVMHENPFSSSVHTDSLGSWAYFGLPAAALADLRKQDGLMQFIVASGGNIERNTFLLPVSRRPLLSYGDWVEPSRVDDLAILQYWGNSIKMSWTATGNDLNEGTATWYDLRYADAPITDDNWEFATPIAGEPSPAPPGSAEAFIILPYDLTETTFLGLRVFDQDYNYSTISNIVQLQNLSELEVIVPDDNLKLVLLQLVGKSQGPIYGADFVGFTDFSALARGIADLDGLEFLSDLKTLDLRSNGLVADLLPLRHLVDLQELRLAGNFISDISPLTLLNQMKVLDLSSNTSLANISGLSGMTLLDSLDLQYCRVSNARPLSTLRKLTYLNLGNNQIRYLDGLDKLRSIRTLLLNNNGLQNLTLLLENPGLGAGDTLDIRGNPYVLYDWTTRGVEIPELERRGVTVLHDGDF